MKYLLTLLLLVAASTAVADSATSQSASECTEIHGESTCGGEEEVGCPAGFTDSVLGPCISKCSGGQTWQPDDERCVEDCSGTGQILGGSSGTCQCQEGYIVSGSGCAEAPEKTNPDGTVVKACSEEDQDKASNPACDKEIKAPSECTPEDTDKPECDKQNQTNEDQYNKTQEALQNACDAELRSAQSTCAQDNTKPDSDNIKNLKIDSNDSAQSNTCKQVKANEVASNATKGHLNKCESAKRACDTQCNKSTEVPIGAGQTKTAQANNNCSRLNPTISKINQQLKDFKKPSQQAQAACKAFEETKEGDTTTAENGAPETAPEETAAAEEKSGDEMAGGSGGLTPPGGGEGEGDDDQDQEVAGDPAEIYPETPITSPKSEQVVSKPRGADLSGSDAYEKEAYGGNNNLDNKAVNAKFDINAKSPNYSGGGKGSELSGRSTKTSNHLNSTNPNLKGQGLTSTKQRNLLLGGYRNVKPQDGGARVSIKPADISKEGHAIVKDKLTKARKKYGKDVPLIFKNGKFVKDFLAAKEDSRNKRRLASLNADGRRELTVADLPVHQNPKLNVFRIINYQYQRQMAATADNFTEQ